MCTGIYAFLMFCILNSLTPENKKVKDLFSPADKAVASYYAMYLNAPTASSKEVFQYFKDRPRPLAKGSDWLDKDLVQRCEELVEQRLTSKDALTKKNGTPVS